MRTDGPVIIALDGSPRSATTLRWGLDEAERRGAPVVLARAFMEPFEYAWGWYLMGDTSALNEAKAYLAEQQDVATEQRPNVRVTTSLLHGPTVPELRDASADAQLLVVGVGADRPRRIGSVAAHIAAHGQCPVAVVRPDPQVEGVQSEENGGRPVVVGVDGSASSLEAAHLAAPMADARGVALEVLHARPTVAAPYGATVPPALAEMAADDPAHDAARRVADGLRARHPGLKVQTTLVDDDPAHALVEASRRAQLLVVGSRGLDAFRGMLLGAVSGHVTRAAECTVLVVHGQLEK